MKTRLSLPRHVKTLLRLATGCLCAFGAASCVSTGGSYGSSYYDGDYDDDYYSGSRSSSYWGSGYGYGGYSHSRCSRCGYYPCRCSHSHSSGGGGHDHDSEKIKLTGGNQRGKPSRPEGYHSAEWYKDRGYNLKNYDHKHQDDGEVHHRSSSSSSHKDDDHKKKH
jgi:hypothetical protein